MATVFLTGASGFLGGHLLRELVTAGHQVKALSRRPETDAPITAVGGEPVRAALATPQPTPACGNPRPPSKLPPMCRARPTCWRLPRPRVSRPTRRS